MTDRLNFWMTAVWSGCIGVGLAMTVSWIWSARQDSAAVRPPVVVFETRFHAVSGRSVWIEMQALRQRDCALTVTSQWQGSDGVIGSRFNPHKALLPAGESHWIRLRMDLPDSLSGGSYWVRSVAEYVCGDGRTFTVPTTWIDVEFEQ